jgi:hypothetical protein
MPCVSWDLGAALLAGVVATVLRPRYEAGTIRIHRGVADFLRPEWNGTDPPDGRRVSELKASK